MALKDTSTAAASVCNDRSPPGAARQGGQLIQRPDVVLPQVPEVLVEAFEPLLDLPERFRRETASGGRQAGRRGCQPEGMALELDDLGSGAVF